MIVLDTNVVPELMKSAPEPGKRREGLARAARTASETYFRGHVLPFDSEAAEAFAALAAGRRRAGRPISQADAQIAAIARSRVAALATRNVPDFEGCGVEIVDPWGAPP
jgi:predicted nucleic acid-binding protein